MEAATLVKAMPGLSLERAKHLIDGCNQAMIRGEMTTRLRAAMFLAQIGHESVSLKYKRELGSGQRYAPYIGRTFIQITWKGNYRKFGDWVGVGDHFVKHPSSLEDDKWAWLGPVWYWTTHDLNRYADRGDVRGATRVINGGYNGLANRQARYQTCVNLGDAILPTKGGDRPPSEEGDWFDMATKEELAEVVRQEVKKLVQDIYPLLARGEHADGKVSPTHVPNSLKAIHEDTQAIRAKVEPTS